MGVITNKIRLLVQILLYKDDGPHSEVSRFIVEATNIFGMQYKMDIFL